MSNILLLRAPSPGKEDRYETTFHEAGYKTISVPVLDTVLTNLSSLKDIIKSGPVTVCFDGVIVTSGRACEAWKSVVGDLMGSSTVATGAGWSSIPFYVVGQATALALSEIRQAYGPTNYTPEIILGDNSGTGERLAHFIRDQLEGRPKKLLYLTGDKNRDTVPTILGDAGIQLHPLQVYETRGSHTFEQDLESALKNSPTTSKTWWIVHFAPSAAGFVVPILNKHFNTETPESNAKGATSNCRIASIGPSTSSFLRDELNTRVNVTAPKPTPQDLAAAIIAYDKDAVF